VRPDVNDTGVIHMIRNGYHYYHNVDVGSLVINKGGKPLFRFNPQCFISEQHFAWWVTGVSQAIEYIDSLGKEVEL
jgi:hypothetical protein